MNDMIVGTMFVISDSDRCKSSWGRVAALVLGVSCLLATSIARGTTGRIIEQIGYENMGGKAGIRLELSLAAAYVKQYPSKSAQIVEVTLQAINPPETNPENLPEKGIVLAQPRDSLPLISVSYELVPPREIMLVLRFQKPVEISVRESRDHRALLVYLPEIPFQGDDVRSAVPELKDSLSEQDRTQLQELMELGRQALQRGDTSTATAIFADVLQLPPNRYTDEAEVLLRTGRLQYEQQKAPGTEQYYTVAGILPLLEEGNSALRTGDAKRAIVAFSKIGELPDNPYSREALEMLGVARQRNGQLAHAKSIYSDYLQRYPEGEDSVRVRQRLQDMLAEDLQTHLPLASGEPKATDEAKSKTEVFGSLSQYYYRGAIGFDDRSGSETDESTLLSYLSLITRTRGDRYDVQTDTYIGNAYDFLDDSDIDNRRIDVTSLYADIRDKTANYGIRLGRQSATSPGVYGRFDGGLLRYDVNKSSRVNVAMGFPRELTNSDSVATDARFIATSLEVQNLWQQVDLAPYIFLQQTAGVIDRRSAGEEFRFLDERFSVFNTMDYDFLYNVLDMFLLNGQWRVDDATDAYMMLDHRESPSLSVSNALLDGTGLGSLEELLAMESPQALRDRAERNTGTSDLVTLGASHNFRNSTQLSFDVSRSRQSLSEGMQSLDPQASAEDTSDLYNLRLTVPSMLLRDDITVFGAGYSAADHYNGTAWLLQNRSPFAQGLRVDSRLRFDTRRFDNGSRYMRIRPSILVSYTLKRQFNLDLELGYEVTDYGGSSLNPDTRRTSFNLGYRWAF